MLHCIRKDMEKREKNYPVTDYRAIFTQQECQKDSREETPPESPKEYVENPFHDVDMRPPPIISASQREEILIHEVSRRELVDPIRLPLQPDQNVQNFPPTDNNYQHPIRFHPPNHEGPSAFHTDFPRQSLAESTQHYHQPSIPKNNSTAFFQAPFPPSGPVAHEKSSEVADPPFQPTSSNMAPAFQHHGNQMTEQDQLDDFGKNQFDMSHRRFTRITPQYQHVDSSPCYTCTATYNIGYPYPVCTVPTSTNIVSSSSYRPVVKQSFCAAAEQKSLPPADITKTRKHSYEASFSAIHDILHPNVAEKVIPSTMSAGLPSSNSFYPRVSFGCGTSSVESNPPLSQSTPSDITSYYDHNGTAVNTDPIYNFALAPINRMSVNKSDENGSGLVSSASDIYVSSSICTTFNTTLSSLRSSTSSVTKPVLYDKPMLSVASSPLATITATTSTNGGLVHSSSTRTKDVFGKMPASASSTSTTSSVQCYSATSKPSSDEIILEEFTEERWNEMGAELLEAIEISNSDLKHAVKEGMYERVRKALNSQKQYNLEQPDQMGMTLVMLAAAKGFDDLVELLVINGANMNAKAKTGNTPLMFAAENGHLCTVAVLLALGAHINIQNGSQETALIKATKKGHNQIVKMLLENGADFSAENATGNTALKYAKLLNSVELQATINQHVKKLTALFTQQVYLTMNNTAETVCSLFPLHVLPLNEGDKFVIHFNHELQPTVPGVGMLLFVAHARITPQETKCRLSGPCAVKTAILNGVAQPTLTDEGQFVLSFSPLHNGRNELIIHTVYAPTSRAKLVVGAYKAKLLPNSEQ
ncbi:ankyrin repeat and KH domain-containing protein mask isoform X2 [Lingula anatina]|uniref:Ankyrin repeat and KH domain-containing protein mask isoform X2 n=1 Tax=Lingula anatina TaxID=7574 RepID=A0A1S3HMJ6_LINAN|nr:ankyrin repeat and KH domain-containing protein mask isoform X2 [Lingula anatina]|eukprot:XP_013386274.1 ankyrin repeat and KH domain-containing protein mask isoform X2 [Lingula anatina]